MINANQNKTKSTVLFARRTTMTAAISVNLEMVPVTMNQLIAFGKWTQLLKKVSAFLSVVIVMF